MTHYAVLGVAEDAPVEEIKRAYHERARRYHPDAHAGSSAAVRAEAERTMQSLNSAWTVLRDRNRRRRYDRALARLAAEEDDGRAWVAARSSSSVRGRGTVRVTTAGRLDDLGLGHHGHGAGAARGGTATASRRRSSTTPVRRNRADLTGFAAWFATPGLQPGTGRGLNLRVTGTSLEPLEALVPDGLAGLHAAGTRIADDDLRSLSAMRSLRLLDLAGTRVTDTGLVHLLGCLDLEVLSLWDTAVTDEGLALLGRLPNLRQLGLGNTAVTDTGLRHLAGLHRLRLVQLSGTEVAGPGLRHLHGLPELDTVTLPWKVGPRHRRLLRSALPRSAVLA